MQLATPALHIVSQLRQRLFVLHSIARVACHCRIYLDRPLRAPHVHASDGRRVCPILDLKLLLTSPPQPSARGIRTQSTMAFQMPPATPQRPTPGAFINTPAPNRPWSSHDRHRMAQPPHPAHTHALPAPPAESSIDRAARTINSMLDRDSRYPALEAYIGRDVTMEKLPYSTIG